MNQAAFRERGEPRWRRFEELLTALERRDASVAAEFPGAFRDVCNDLALAQSRHLDSDLVERLNGLVLRGHQHLYRARRGTLARLASFWGRDLPRVVRAEARVVLAALVLFYGVGGAIFAACRADPDLPYSVAGHDMIVELEAMYDPANRIVGRGRDEESDAVMFGVYIYNNISIAFRTFAGGILAGIGALFFLLYNGMLLGAASAHMLNVGFDATFFTFVVAHGAPELNAVVLAAAAGLKLGWALIAPERLHRVEALKLAARHALPLVYGATLMLVLAAGIEAFWSARPYSPEVKYGVGAVMWVMTAAYFLFAGRQRAAR